MTLPADTPAPLWSRDRSPPKLGDLILHNGLVIEARVDRGHCVVEARELATDELAWQLAIDPMPRDPADIVTVDLHVLDEDIVAIELARTTTAVVQRISTEVGRIVGEQRIAAPGPVWIHPDGAGGYATFMMRRPNNVVQLCGADGKAYFTKARDAVMAAGGGAVVVRELDQLECYREGERAWRIGGGLGLSAYAGREPATAIVGASLVLRDNYAWNEWAESPDDPGPPPAVTIAAFALDDGRPRWDASFASRELCTGWLAGVELACIGFPGLVHPIRMTDGAVLPAVELGAQVRLHQLDARRLLWSNETEISCTDLIAGGEPAWSIPPPGVGAFQIRADRGVVVCVHEHSIHAFGATDLLADPHGRRTRRTE